MVHQHAIWHGISFPLNHPNRLRAVGDRTDAGSGWVFKKPLHMASACLSPHQLTLCSQQNSSTASRSRLGQPPFTPACCPPCRGLGGHLPSKPGSPTLVGFPSFSVRSLSPAACLHVQRPRLNNYLASPESSG